MESSTENEPPSTGRAATSPAAGRSVSTTSDRILAGALVGYLLAITLLAFLMVVLNFPETDADGTITFPRAFGDGPVFWPFTFATSAEQGLILLAFVAGMAGSFLHAAQSLTSYLGNSEFGRSWAPWYFLRPWIGGVLGFSLYFAIRAGLVSGTTGVNPFGTVALGVLGGWFSKTTTDKLQEVFDTLFKTDADRERRDKLRGASETPAGVVADESSTTTAG